MNVLHFLRATALAAVLATTMLAPSHAWAQTPPAAAVDWADGEVRKIDREARRLTLKHGEIKSLDMPPMTMVFSVAEGVPIDKLQPGDKLRFRATSDGGRMVVTELQPAR